MKISYLLVFSFISQSIFCQISQVWKHGFGYYNNSFVEYLGYEDSSHYLLTDSINFVNSIFKISDNNYKKLGSVSSQFGGFHNYYHHTYFDGQSIVSGLQQFVNSAGAIVNLNDTSKKFLSASNNKSSIFLKSQEVSGNLYSVGFISFYDPTLWKRETFDDLVIYKLDGNLNPKDSIFIDLESPPDRGLFINCFFSENGISVYTFNPLDSINSIVHDFIDYNLDSTSREIFVTSIDKEFSQDYIKLFFEDSKLYCSVVLADTLTGAIKVVIGELKNSKFYEIKSFKYNLYIGDVINSKFNPYPRFKVFSNSSKLGFVISPHFTGQDSILIFESFDTSGNSVQSFSINLNEFFNPLNLRFLNDDVAILDSSIVLKGSITDLNNLDKFETMLLLKPPFTPKLIIDSNDIHDAWEYVLPTFLSSSFLIKGKLYNKTTSDFEDHHFAEYSVENFTLGIRKNKLHKEDFFIFPNPSKSTLNFQQIPNSISIYNLSGNLLFKDSPNSNRLNLNLKPGVYIIKSQYGDYINTEKLIISSP